MSDDIGRERAAFEPELIETRRALHRHPELGFAEHETAALVTERLRALGYEPQTGVGRTGVIADLEGAGPGPTLLIRADMDALALDEVPHGRTARRPPAACTRAGTTRIPARYSGSRRC